MPSLSTPALVIRRADYGDYDRMVTLFSPHLGRVDAIARGCKKPKSPLLNACEPFVNGEFQLFQRAERFSIEQCQITESFFDLRMNYDRLQHGVYWLKLLDAAVMPDVEMPDLFLITLRALAHLNYSELPPEMLTTAEMSVCPRPVIVMTPAMMPATPQAQATVSVLRVPFSSASKNFFGVRRVSFLNMLTTIAAAVATIAENAMV